MKTLRLIERVLVIIAIVCILLLLGANIARTEIEERAMREMEIVVTDDAVLIYHKGNVYEHER